MIKEIVKYMHLSISLGHKLDIIIQNIKNGKIKIKKNNFLFIYNSIMYYINSNDEKCLRKICYKSKKKKKITIQVYKWKK